MKKWDYKDFNNFKKNYEKYTFEDKVKINKKIGEMFPEQSNWCSKSLIDFFSLLSNNLKVCEIGCWDGALAETIINFQNEKIKSWNGYDIPGSTKKYDDSSKITLNILEDYLWKMDKIDCDVFVASHTLEHLNIEELDKLLEFLSKNNVDYIYSDTPILENWKDTWNTHVLQINKERFDNLFRKHGYVSIKETGPHSKYNYRQLFQRVGKDVFIHNTSIIDKNVTIGENTKIWAFSHISEGAKIGKNVTIGEGVFIGKDVKIGDNSKIQNGSLIYKGVTIENDVFIGPNVVTTNDIYPDTSNNWDHRFRKTLIKEKSSIGANTTIICGNTINENVLVGAGSVITKNLDSNHIYLGNPARKIRRKNA